MKHPEILTNAELSKVLIDIVGDRGYNAQRVVDEVARRLDLISGDSQADEYDLLGGPDGSFKMTAEPLVTLGPWTTDVVVEFAAGRGVIVAAGDRVKLRKLIKTPIEDDAGVGTC